MENSQRFSESLGWKQTDRILTYDVLDNEKILTLYGGYDSTRDYTFEEVRVWFEPFISYIRDIFVKNDPYVDWWCGRIKCRWLKSDRY